jgi:ABC-type methionine transport system ATPase subunit
MFSLCSAVDAHVGSRIFNDAICGVLYSKTRLLVTHGLQYITRAHSIYVLQDGTVAEKGTFDELVNRPNSLLSAVVSTYESEAKDAYDEAKVRATSCRASVSNMRSLVCNGLRV